MRGGANLPLVSTYNRSVVLDAVRSAGTLSRVELVEATGLTAATVGNIVRRLIDDGLVVEAGRGASRGGKPRTLLRLEPTARYAVGVQLDSDAVTYVVTDLSGAPVVRSSTAGVGTTPPAEVVAEMADRVEHLVADAGVRRDRVLGIGVALPGPLDHARGVVGSPPNLRGWVDVPVATMLSERCGLPVVVDNDATAAAVGERWMGTAADVRSFACVFMSTGIGAGLVLDGQVHRGVTSNAGELGHISLDLDGPLCYCGNRGCLELYSAPQFVVRAARAWPVADRRSAGLPAAAAGTRAQYAALARAAAAGHRPAASLVDRSARAMATAVVTLVNLVDVEMVVLAGPAFALVGDAHVRRIREALRTQSLARDRQNVEVHLSPVADDIGALGAASLVLHDRLAPPMAGLSTSRPRRP